MSRILVFGVVACLTACGPTSPRLAADQCEERARAATGPTGLIGVGVGSEGMSSKFKIGVTSDYLQKRDPYTVYDQCVRQKSGQGPIRPLDIGR